MPNVKLTYQLNFQGYWRHVNRGGLPAISGVYVVYRCRYNQTTDKVSLIEIIYIGQAENIKERLQEHDKFQSFQNELGNGEELCYTCAQVEVNALDLVENALIVAQKPRLNVQQVNTYNHQPAHIKIDGCCACMRYTDFSIS